MVFIKTYVFPNENHTFLICRRRLGDRRASPEPRPEARAEVDFEDLCSATGRQGAIREFRSSKLEAGAMFFKPRAPSEAGPSRRATWEARSLTDS